MCPLFRPPLRLVRDVAALETRLNSKSKRDRDVRLELSEVVSVNLAWKAESGINNVGGGVAQKVLGDGTGAWVLRAEPGNRSGRRAFHVLLPVDGALREDGALKLGEVCPDLGIEAIVHHEAGLKLGIGDDSEELGGTGVNMWGVKAAGLKEEPTGRETKSGQHGEVSRGSKVDLTPHCILRGRGVGYWVEVEHERVEGGICGRVDDLQTGVFATCKDDAPDKGCGRWWVGDTCWDAQEWRGCGGSHRRVGSNSRRGGMYTSGCARVGGRRQASTSIERAGICSGSGKAGNEN